MTMTGTTTIIMTVKASIIRPRSASAIGPLGLRTTNAVAAAGQERQQRDRGATYCNDCLLHAPARTDD